MILLPLAPIPNQQLALRAGGFYWIVTFKACGDIMTASIVRDQETILDNVRVVAGQPLIPYRYLEAGNFIFITGENKKPYYDLFGVSQQLYYLNADEVTELRAKASLFDRSERLPLRLTSSQSDYVSGQVTQNFIRNNRMNGAAVNTLPTYWSSFIGGGLNQEILNSGIEDFINYIDWRVYGTIASASGCALYSETETQVPALSGEEWCYSAYIRLLSGSLANINQVRFIVDEFTSSGTYISSSFGNGFTPTGDPLGWQRKALGVTLNGGVTTARVRPTFEFNFNSVGSTIDVVFRVGLPQLERGLFPTPVVRTP